MSKSFTIHEAEGDLDHLIQQVEAGEEVVIARGDKPVARLVALAPPRHADRQPGIWKGKVTLAPGWDEPLPPEVIEAFFESKLEPQNP